ncbi:MAG: alpha/beta hydrolase [Pseudomonadota bacterium]
MTLKLLALLAVLLGAGAVATAWRSAANARATETAYPPEGAFVEVILTMPGQGAETRALVHYTIEGTGPDLILIHGASGSTRDFSWAMVPALRDRYRVITFDRPGFGYSTRIPGATIADQAAILAAAADQIGIRRPIVLGQSYGGAVALAWALQRDDTAALVLVSAASNPWTTGIGAYYTALSSAPGQAFMAPLLSAWVPDAAIDTALGMVFAPNPAPQGYADHIGPRLSLRLPTLRENATQRRTLLGEITDQVVRYPELSLPIEILHGTDDTIVPAATHSEPLSRQLRNADLRLLDGIGHMPHHVALDEVLAAIDRAAARAGLP